MSDPVERRTAQADAVLAGAVDHLADAGDHKGVIRLVERWAAAERPPRRARLHLVRSLLDLRLMDRAWLRLKELFDEVGRDGEDREVSLLAARILVQRGWFQRAAGVIDEALRHHPGDPELTALATRVQGPPPAAPSDLQAMERTRSPAALMELAERFLAAGSFIRARTVLERIRTLAPDNERARDLLWGLQGDFQAGEGNAEQLARELAPALFEHHDELPGDELEEEEQHEEVTAARIPVDGGTQGAEFPSLFRRFSSPPHGEDDETGEVTQSGILADPEELKDPSSGGAGEAPAPASKHDDTEIMMVIKGAGLVPVDGGGVHRQRSQEYNLKATMDLSDYRSRMGADSSDLPRELASDATGPGDLEDEDADLVVVTRQEKSTLPRASGPRHTGGDAGRLRVVEKVPTPVESPPPARQGPAAGPPPPPPTERRRVAPPPMAPRPEPASHARRSFTRPLLLGLAALTLALAVWVTWSGGLPGAQARRAVAADGVEDLLASQEALSMDLEERPVDTALQAALARVEVALWRDFQPRAEHLERARLLVEAAMAEAPEHPDVLLAAAELASEEGRVEEAMRLLESRGVQDEGAWLVRAAAALSDDDEEAALAAARSAHDGGSHRARRALADVLRRVGATEEAEALIGDLDRPWSDLHRAILGPISQERDQATEALLRRARRDGHHYIEARYHIERAARHRMEGDALGWQRHLKLAAKVDGRWPDLLFARALEDMDAGRPMAALEKLEEAAHLRPGDISAQMFRLRLLVDLDRVEEAGEVNRALAEARPGHPRLAVARGWLAMAEAAGSPTGADNTLPGLLGPYLADHPDDGEALWLMGLATARRDPPTALEYLLAAGDNLQLTRDPALWRLIPRVVAARVLAGDPKAQSLEARVTSAFSHDPWVHLVLGLAAEHGGGRRGAVRHLSTAAKVAPELAIAHFHLYRLSSGTGSMDALHRYTALSPSGPRARELSALTR